MINFKKKKTGYYIIDSNKIENRVQGLDEKFMYVGCGQQIWILHCILHFKKIYPYARSGLEES